MYLYVLFCVAKSEIKYTTNTQNKFLFNYLNKF